MFLRFHGHKYPDTEKRNKSQTETETQTETSKQTQTETETQTDREKRTSRVFRPCSCAFYFAFLSREPQTRRLTVVHCNELRSLAHGDEQAVKDIVGAKSCAQIPTRAETVHDAKRNGMVRRNVKDSGQRSRRRTPQQVENLRGSSGETVRFKHKSKHGRLRGQRVQ